MKIFKVEFEAIWPVGCCCIIAAETLIRAEEIAQETITHTSIMKVVEVSFEKECVIEYLSGDY